MKVLLRNTRCVALGHPPSKQCFEQPGIGLDVPARFGALTDKIVGTEIEGCARTTRATRKMRRAR
jgi:hypothetical protein